MPRFASNLSFSPLEPLKPSTAAPTSYRVPLSTTNSIASSGLSTSALSTGPVDVPAAQFDWNGSGLVNPLDGMHPKFYLNFSHFGFGFSFCFEFFIDFLFLFNFCLKFYFNEIDQENKIVSFLSQHHSICGDSLFLFFVFFCLIFFSNFL